MNCPHCGFTPVSDSEVIESMSQPSEGAFCNHLAEAAKVADSSNLYRIKMTFFHIWARHVQLVRERKLARK